MKDSGNFQNYKSFNYILGFDKYKGKIRLRFKPVGKIAEFEEPLIVNIKKKY